MKKNLIIGALSVLLIIALFVIVRQERPAQEPPAEPAPQADHVSLAEPEPLAEPAPAPVPEPEPEKMEISQEELEPIFEKVYTENSGNHPEDWSIDFQITDEVGKINKAIPEDKKAPENLREIYTEWRAAKTEAENAETQENLDGYDQGGVEVVAGVTEEDIQANQDTSPEDSYDEGRDYDPSTEPNTEGYSSFITCDPMAGRTEEDLQQGLEESHNTEFKIAGT